jgi:hypothetical protein
MYVCLVLVSINNVVLAFVLEPLSVTSFLLTKIIPPTEKSLDLCLDIMASHNSLLLVSDTDIVDGNGKRIILKGVSQDVAL